MKQQGHNLGRVKAGTIFSHYLKKMKQQLTLQWYVAVDAFLNMVSSSILPFGFVGEADRQFQDQWGSATPLRCFPWVCL
jgi:hypothetical protein